MEIINGVKVASEPIIDGDLTINNGDLVVTEGDIDLVHADKKLLLPLKDDGVNPTVAFGDGDSGLYESSDDNLKISIGGSTRWEITSTALSSTATYGGRLTRTASSATVPGCTFKGDGDTGVGLAATDTLSLIAGGVEGHRITEAAGSIIHELTGTVQGPDLNNQMVQKATFDVLGLMTDPRFLNLMCEDPGSGTMTDVSGQGYNGTYQGSMTTGDRVKKGMGWAVDFDGTNDYVDFGDHDDFSFGDGTNDEAITWFGVIDSGGNDIITKWDTTIGLRLREYIIYIDSLKRIVCKLCDESGSSVCNRTTDSGISTGPHSIVVTYDGTGGATAADGIMLYVDGVEVSSTATNNASYVAMENLSTSLWLGAAKSTTGTAEAFIEGDLALFGIDGSEWSAYDVHRFHQLCKGLYGI